MKRNISFSLLLIILLIVVSGYIFGLPITDVYAKEQQNTPADKIKIGYIPIAECAHLYVGIAKKFFAQENLEVELLSMKGGAAILPAVQNGDLHIGFTNVPSLIILDSNLSPNDSKLLVSLVGASYEIPGNSNHALLIMKGSKFTINDLGNTKTKIAINTTRNIEELMLRRFLSLKNIKGKFLNLVPIGFPEMLSALERKDVDIASVVEPFIEPALRSGRFSLLARQYLEVSPKTIVATYATTNYWLNNNKDIANRFIMAFKKADYFIKHNDQETRKIIGTFARIRQEDLPVIGMPFFDTIVSKDSMQVIIDEMVKYGFIKKSHNPEIMIYKLDKR